MLGIALTLVMAQAQPAVVAPWSAFDGKSWAGITFGISERDLKNQFKTGKTEISDPASVRVQTDRKEWIVSAVLTQQGGKGSVVGIAVERDKDALDSLDNLTKDLGAPDQTRYPSPRFGDWAVLHWKEKGIAAVVEGPRVRKLLMAPPETLASRVSLMAQDEERERVDTRIEVGDIDVRSNVKMKDGTAETLAEVQMQRAADRAFQRYEGDGWLPVRGGRSSIVINFTIERKDKDYRMQVSGTLNVRSKLGEDTWTTNAQTATEREALAVGLRIEPMVERVMRDLGKKADESIKRLVWQAEWRPFYALSRP
jgi:hypothetical protein